MTEDKLRAIDIRLLDDIFGMGDGYVLDFSNKSLAEFFKDEHGVDIYSPVFETNGTSKANRLRSFLKQASPHDALKVLNSLWEYRESSRRRSGTEELKPWAKTEFFNLIERLGGKTL